VIRFLPDLLPCVRFRLPSLIRDSVLELICDARTSSTRPEQYKSRLVPLHAIDFECGHDGRESNAPSALDVVIKTSDFWCVLVQDSASVVEAKVLEVEVGLWVAFSACLNECGDKLVVLVAAGAGLAETEIQVVIKMFLVLRTISLSGGL
jgi:hypothetical protein